MFDSNKDPYEITKKATKEKDKNIYKAIEYMKEAISVIEKIKDFGDGINFYIKIAMYLQKAGKNDEGWGYLGKALERAMKYNDKEIAPMAASQVYEKQRVFLEREKSLAMLYFGKYLLIYLGNKV